MLLELPALKIVGSISKLHGYEGKLKITLKPEIRIVFPKKIKEPVFIQMDGMPVPFFYTELDQGDSFFILKAEEINSEIEAKKMVGLQILVPETWIKSTLPGGQTMDDLVGFRVFDQNNTPIGPILSVMPGKQSLLEVQAAYKSIFIPLHEDLVLDIKPRKKEIYIEIAEGLMDL